MATTEAPPTLSVIQQRYETDSKPGFRTDDYIVSAVFEPGAMRSIIVASEATAFSLLGRRNSLDKTKGGSSGGIIGMSLAGEQTREMLETFLYRVPHPEFINIGRLLLGRNIANIEWFVKEILMKEPKLDWERVRDSDIHASILARSAVSGDLVAFDNFDTEEEFSSALMAATWMPRVAGWKPHIHNGHPYWDLMENGLEHAVDDGSTHIVVFRSKPDKMKLGAEVLKSDVDIAEIKPKTTIRRLETRQRVLKDAVRVGAWAVIEALEPTSDQIEELRQRYDDAFGVSL